MNVGLSVKRRRPRRSLLHGSLFLDLLAVMRGLLEMMLGPLMVVRHLLVVIVRLLVMVTRLLVVLLGLLDMEGDPLRMLLLAMVRGALQVMDRPLMMVDGALAMMGRLLMMAGCLLMMRDSPVVVADGLSEMAALACLHLLVLGEGSAADGNSPGGNHATHGKSSESLLDHEFLHSGGRSGSLLQRLPL